MKISVVLLFVAAAAANLAASALGDLAKSMKAGEWRELVTQNIGVLNQPGTDGNIITYGEDAAWDPNSETFFYVGNDHIDGNTSQALRFVLYHAATNTWQNMPAPPFSSAGNTDHGNSHHAVNAKTGEFFRRGGKSGGRFYRYSNNAWTALPANNLILYDYACCGGVEYFPELGGLVLAQGGETTLGGGVFVYRSSTGQWVRLAKDLPMNGYPNWASYNPVHKIVVFGRDQALYKLDSLGKTGPVKKAPFNFYVGNGWHGGLTADPVSGEYISHSSDIHNFYAYNVGADAWRPLTINGIPNLNQNSIIATPVENHGVIMYVGCRATTCKAYLYKHSAGSAAESGLPDLVSVLSAAPNPARGAAVIRVPDGVAELRVHDTAGRLVANLDNMISPRISWRTEGLPSGVYIVRAGAGKANSTVKIFVSR